MTKRTNRDFRALLQGMSLTTAEILYRMPDHPSVLQTFIWQDFDFAPRFPKLRTFLEFWSRSLDGRLYQVRVAHAGLVRPAEIKMIDHDFKLN